MELSVICPTLNEINFIDQLIDDLCANDGLEKEVLILDGGSTDGTTDRVRELQKKYSCPLAESKPILNAAVDVRLGLLINVRQEYFF